MAFKKVLVDYLGKLAEMLGTDTIHPDQLGSGTRDGTKVLRDDGTWVTAGEGATYTGDKEITGVLKGNNLFKMSETIDYGATGTIVYIDNTIGVDGLPPENYYGSTASVGDRFQTIEACVRWINQGSDSYYLVIIQNTSVGSPISLYTNVIAFKNKVKVIFGGESPASIAYISMNTRRFSIVKSDVTFINLVITSTRTNEPFFIGNDGGSLELDTVTLTTGNTNYIFLLSDGRLNINKDTVINFSKNNQNLIHCSGNYGGKVIISNHSLPFTLNVGAYTGLRWATIAPSRALETWFPDLPGITIPSNIDMSNTVIYYGTSLALKQTEYDINSANYALNLGGSNPLRFLDKNSSSPDGTYTTIKALGINEDGEVIPYTNVGGGLTKAEVRRIALIYG